MGYCFVESGRPRRGQAVCDFSRFCSDARAKHPVRLRLSQESPIYRLLCNITVKVRVALRLHIKDLNGLDGMGYSDGAIRCQAPFKILIESQTSELRAMVVSVHGPKRIVICQDNVIIYGGRQERIATVYAGVEYANARHTR